MSKIHINNYFVDKLYLTFITTFLRFITSSLDLGHYISFLLSTTNSFTILNINIYNTYYQLQIHLPHGNYVPTEL